MSSSTPWKTLKTPLLGKEIDEFTVYDKVKEAFFYKMEENELSDMLEVEIIDLLWDELYEQGARFYPILTQALIKPGEYL